MDNIETAVFKRSLAPVLLDTARKGVSFLLMGPRQTGKSTLLEDLFSKLPPARVRKHYFQLPSQRAVFEADPETLVREVEAAGSGGPIHLFIDEIQKVPQAMDVLQYLIDRRKIVLAASGSSARKLKKLGTNWLPGRVRLARLHPLTWRETEFRPDRLGDVLRFGALPRILSLGDHAQREAELSAYAHLYLEEEIRAEAAVRNVPRFGRFLRLAAFESGTAPNCSKIGARVELSHTTIREYFQILEDTLVVHRVDAFGGTRDAVLRSPRYYFFDVGVRNAAAGIGHSEGVLTLQMGVLFEHWVVLELLARLQGDAPLFYWRTRQGVEVDAVVERGGRRVAMEIKATDRPAAADFRGLDAFCKGYGKATGYLVCRVPRPQKFGPHLAIPWWEAAERLE